MTFDNRLMRPRFWTALALCVCLALSAPLSFAAETPAAPLSSSPVDAVPETQAGIKSQDAFLQEISLDLRDMDIVDVLKFLSLKGKFNLAISRNITGRVTLAMKKVTIGDALDIILKANALAYYRTNNIVYVMTAEEYLSTYGKKFNDRTEIKIVNLQYAKPSYVLAALDSIKSNVGKIVIDEDTGSVVMIDTAENLKKMVDVLDQMDTGIATSTYKLQYAVAKDVAAQLKLRLDAKSVGSIQADDRSNQVILSAFPDRLKEAEQIIKELDSPTKAVLIEVRILQITLNPKYDYGIDWSNPFGNSSEKGLRAIDVVQSFPISSTVSAIGTMGSLTYGGIDPAMLQLKIRALKQVVNSRVIARPRLMVTNNQEANIHIGDTIPYVTSTTTGTGDTATVSEQINFIDVGIKLKVLPTINDDGMVTMKIRPEISTRTKDVETPQKALIPQVNTTFVETNAIVKDGHTVIIGGLKQLTNKDSRQGLPHLMDVPVAGKLFRNDASEVLDSAIVIFLTPHIIRGEHDETLTQPNIHPDQPYQEEDAIQELVQEQPVTEVAAEKAAEETKPTPEPVKTESKRQPLFKKLMPVKQKSDSAAKKENTTKRNFTTK